MIRKILNVTTLAFCSLTTIAQASTSFKSGFVAGGSVGYSYMNNAFNTSGVETTTLATSAQATKKSVNASSLVGTLFTGYRYVTASGMVVGFNLGVSKDGNAVKNVGTLTTTNPIDFTTKLTRAFQVTPALVLGYCLSDRWMVFTQLGLSISRFNLKSNRVATAGAQRPVIDKNTTFTKVGFAPTLGAEYAMTQNLSVIGTATYEYFGKVKKDVGSSNVTPLVINFQTSNSVTVKPSYFTAKVGVMYKF